MVSYFLETIKKKHYSNADYAAKLYKYTKYSNKFCPSFCQLPCQCC